MSGRSRTMSRKRVWYSGELNDFVDSMKTVAVGHLDNSGGIGRSRTVGLRYYELSDHLGNVVATVLDRKTGVLASGSATLYDRWKADVASLTDYYPFGMQMPGRVYEAGIGLANKFGFSGQLRSDEVYGGGNLNTALFGELDIRVGRRWNLDPKPSIGESRYSVFGNNPIFKIDILLDSPIQKNSITKMDFSKLEENYPSSGKAIYERPGSVLNSLKPKDPDAHVNTCAIKMSECLNKAGYEIPTNPPKTLNDLRVFIGKKVDNGNFIVDAAGMGKFLRSIEKPTYCFTKLTTDEEIESAIETIHKSDDLRGIMVLTAGDRKAYGASGHTDLIYEDFMWDISILGYGGTDLKGYLEKNKSAKFMLEIWVIDSD